MTYSIYELGDRTPEEFQELPFAEFIALAESILELTPELMHVSGMRIYQDLVVLIASCEEFCGVARVEFCDDYVSLLSETSFHSPDHRYLVPHMRNLLARLVHDTQTVHIDD